MHSAIGLGVLVTAIAFAFGQRTAQFFVGAVLILGGAGAVFIAVIIASKLQ